MHRLLHRTASVAFVSVALVAVAGLSAQKPGSFGSKDPGLYNLKGTIYFLPEDTEKMPPDVESLKPEGVIYTDRLDVPTRDFSEGFPGVTNRFEWFGLIYTGQFQIDRPGDYTWRLVSDDGSRLWIDDKEVIDNDGVHGTDPKDGTVNLARGVHALRVWYFQGPATELSLQLFVGRPGGEEKIFAMGDYAAGLAAAMKKVNAEATPDGIRVRMDAAILFVTAKADLLPAAREAIQAVNELIAAYPDATVRVFGFTDSIGDDGYNLKLSEARAASVRAALVAAGAPKGVTFETKGFGEARPVASNDSESGRAQNRRVEVYIKP